LPHQEILVKPAQEDGDPPHPGKAPLDRGGVSDNRGPVLPLMTGNMAHQLRHPSPALRRPRWWRHQNKPFCILLIMSTYCLNIGHLVALRSPTEAADFDLFNRGHLQSQSPTLLNPA